MRTDEARKPHPDGVDRTQEHRWRTSWAKRFQITIGKKVREALGIRPGDRADEQIEDGRLVVDFHAQATQPFTAWHLPQAGPATHHRLGCREGRRMGCPLGRDHGGSRRRQSPSSAGSVTVAERVFLDTSVLTRYFAGDDPPRSFAAAISSPTVPSRPL
jgi:hypothetical protein